MRLINNKLFHLSFLFGSKQSSYVRSFSSSTILNSVGGISGLRVLQYPAPELRAPNVEISDFNDELKQLSRKMFDLMYEDIGAGLAAPQVGVNKRLMVYNPRGDPRAWLSEVVLVNPRIVEASKDVETDEEACLSFPDISGPVQRHSRIKVEAQNLIGDKFSLSFEGFEARLFQHEYDHLSGILFIDHLDEKHKKIIQPVLHQLEAQFNHLAERPQVKMKSVH